MDAFFLLVDFSFIVKPAIDSVKSIFVRLQADNSLRADAGIMNSAGRQIELVAGIQNKLLPQLRQAKCDTSLHHADNLVVGM